MTAPALTRTRWEDDADPELWWPNPRTPIARDTNTGLALHICLTHCPVQQRCAAAAEQNPPTHPVVLGGVRWVQVKEVGRRGIHPAARGPAPHSHGCPYCRRSAR